MKTSATLSTRWFLLVTVAVLTADCSAADLKNEAVATMKSATRYFQNHVASHGGYVYFYSLDLNKRWGEGVATKDQIWVQPPGTPTVGMALLKAHQATGDRDYLDAATAAAEALVYGQLQSGGWTNCVDFNPRGERTAKYRNGKGNGKNNSSLDDGQTQSALRFLIQADAAHNFRHQAIHESATLGLQALLNAQFDNGGFPQVWTGPVESQPILKAGYPDYDWRSEGRIKDYWNLCTLNDNVCGHVADTLIEAHRTYDDNVYLESLKRLGEFLLLAQMPEPQPAWAQQYNNKMQPVWARRFEPPGISGDESQEAIATLMTIAEVTGDKRFLAPIPSALAWLRRSLLKDGRLARYYELKSNRPLYMTRRGRDYSLTYNDSNLPAHYGWKTESQLDQLQQRYRAQLLGEPLVPQRPGEDRIGQIIADLDRSGRWVSVADGSRLVGQPKIAPGEHYLSSEEFSKNLTTLARFVSAQKK